ncbi:MAG: M42 family metallopeptidase [Chloroflexota bacterium]|nr:M42 family metallopeptidase [Chloroflexota bacterium]
MEVIPFLRALSEAAGVSGYENSIRELVIEKFSQFADEVRTDKLGNLIALKRGEGQGPHPRVMLAGHMDEIGLMITAFKEGFLHFTTVGGIDPRVLLGQEVVVHGRRNLPGIISSRPPHVLPEEEREKPRPTEKLFIDLGLPQEELTQWVQVGDLVTIQRRFTELKNGWAAGKAFDDRAAVTAIALCLAELARMRHEWDVYAVATVQEEVGLRGAITSTYDIMPQVGIAIDVGFGAGPGQPEGKTIEMDKGPAIAFGPNIHPKVHEGLVEAAQVLEIPHQIEPIPGRSGTDAWAMQITREGIPTGLLSIPLRYMHTSVETLVIKDIERTGRLLAGFIGRLDEAFIKALNEQLQTEEAA